METEDTIICPICKNKLRTIYLSNKFLFGVNKHSNYIERTCTKAVNHSLQFFTDAQTKKIDFIKVSLDHKYSKFIEIDFINQKSRISCMKAGKAEYIDVDRLLDPDFPDLEKLKEKVSLLITLS